MPIKKTQFVASLAEKWNVSKKEAAQWLDDMMAEIIKSVRTGDKKLNLSGFGVFKVVDRPARMVRNPRTGEMIQAKASKKVRFVAAKALKEAVL